MGSQDKAEVITPPTQLRDKVTTGGPGAIDETVLQRAEAVLVNMTEDYLGWAGEDLDRLQGEVDKAAKAAKEAKDKADVKTHIEEAFRIVHDMKGQGGSFNYQLVTRIANQLCHFLENLETLGPREQEVVQLHLDGMRLVVTRKMTGDGGAAGKGLVDGLDACIRKFRQR
ncbi:MAG: Hpt domain-containing protein [Proteobacteria bacterium]|nr:Hpt domain-containing protein [Pseudomonadota bacterium]